MSTIQELQAQIEEHARILKETQERLNAEVQSKRSSALQQAQSLMKDFDIKPWEIAGTKRPGRPLGWRKGTVSAGTATDLAQAQKALETLSQQAHALAVGLQGSIPLKRGPGRPRKQAATL